MASLLGPRTDMRRGTRRTSTARGYIENAGCGVQGRSERMVHEVFFCMIRPSNSQLKVFPQSLVQFFADRAFTNLVQHMLFEHTAPCPHAVGTVAAAFHDQGPLVSEPTTRQLLDN